MKLTREQAERAIEAGFQAKAPNGNFWRARRNGKTKVWARSPERYQIPIRMGFRGNTYATEQSEWNFYGEGPNADFQCEAVAEKWEILNGPTERPKCSA